MSTRAESVITMQPVDQQALLEQIVADEQHKMRHKLGMIESWIPNEVSSGRTIEEKGYHSDPLGHTMRLAAGNALLNN